MFRLNIDYPISCVILDKSLNYSVPQFLHLYNEDNYDTSQVGCEDEVN